MSERKFDAAVTLDVYGRETAPPLLLVDQGSAPIEPPDLFSANGFTPRECPAPRPTPIERVSSIPRPAPGHPSFPGV